ncbi:hypothetical protein SNE510_54560 [Streptomyces sp. NE5-10]|nr:hypothetical protein SNE510_54560 [Streptomyces sp. NE5-10]
MGCGAGSGARGGAGPGGGGARGPISGSDGGTRGSIRDQEEGSRARSGVREAGSGGGRPHAPADGGRGVRAFSGPFSPRGVAPDGEGAHPPPGGRASAPIPGRGRWSAAGPSGSYGTQWLPETVIITWSWMLAEK